MFCYFRLFVQLLIQIFSLAFFESGLKYFSHFFHFYFVHFMDLFWDFFWLFCFSFQQAGVFDFGITTNYQAALCVLSAKSHRPLGCCWWWTMDLCVCTPYRLILSEGKVVLWMVLKGWLVKGLSSLSNHPVNRPP